MHTRVLCLYLVAALLFPVVAASTGTLLRGEFSQDPALLIDGALGSNSTAWFLRYPVPMFSGPVLDAKQVQLVVQEQRFPLGIHASPKAVHASPRSEAPITYQRRFLYDLEAELDRAVPGTQWELRGQPESRLTLASSHCRLTRAPALDPQAMEVFERRPDDFLAPLVEASCGTDGVHADTRLDWMVWNTTLVLRHRDPSSGERTVEELRTGVSVEDSRVVPGTRDRVERRAVIRWTHANVSAHWPAAQEVRVWAPIVAAQGAMALEKGGGEVLWGTSRFEGAPTDPAPTGWFSVRPQYADGLGVHGVTENAPRGEGRMQGPYSSIAFAASLTVGAMLLAFGAWALYARITGHDIGRHPARASLIEFLECNPGARLTEIRTGLGMPRSTALHHLRALQRGGLVVQRRVGKFLIYGLKHQCATLADPTFLAQRVGRNEFVLQVLRERPGLRQQEIASSVGITQSYVSRILARLEREGLVERTEQDRRRFRLREAASGPQG